MSFWKTLSKNTARAGNLQNVLQKGAVLYSTAIAAYRHWHVRQVRYALYAAMIIAAARVVNNVLVII